MPLLRYNNGAVLLHWLTALIVTGQVLVGATFADMEQGPDRVELFTVHATLGAVILLLTLTRLAWRIANPPPPYPLELARWERIAGTWTHRLFYVLLIALPLTGLIAASGGATGARATTPLLGGLALPLLPGISEATGEQVGGVHEALVFVTLALLALHIAAALRHQIQPGRAAGRMPPFAMPRKRAAPLPQNDRA